METPDLKNFPPWLRRINNDVEVGIGTRVVTLREKFGHLFVEFCDRKNIECSERERAEFDTHRYFEIPYANNLEYECVEDQNDGFVWEFASYLMEEYGNEDPTSD